jgi:outer membrane receptor protein involved in Fe transport
MSPCPRIVSPIAWSLISISSAAFAEEVPSGIEEIIVTGTHIAHAWQRPPAALLTLAREDIAARGVVEAADVLDTLTLNTGSENNPDAFTQNFTTGTSNVNLRGLGVGSTLVLINGRRQTQSAAANDRGENFVDLASLPPLILIDRIEILGNGASALYGSDAVAGVVNFVTRENHEGLDIEVDLQSAGGGSQHDRQVSAAYGARGPNQSRLVAGLSVLDRTALTTADRRLSDVADDLSQAGNPGSFLVPALPGNPMFQPAWSAAFDRNGNEIADQIEAGLGLAPVAGAVPPVLADQDCLAVAARDVTVVPTIRRLVPSALGMIPIGLCQFDFGAFWNLVPEERRRTFYLGLSGKPSRKLAARVDVHGARNEARRSNSPSFPIGAFPVVASTHPDNPYGTEVRFIGRVVGAGGTALESVHRSDTRRIAGAIRGPMTGSWAWEVGAQQSRNDFYVAVPDVLADRLDAALAGFGGPRCDRANGAPGIDPCRFYNPFGSALTGTGTANAPELLRHLFGHATFDARASLTTLEALFTGERGAIGGRPVGIAAGMQRRHEHIEYDYDPSSNRDNFLFITGNPDFADGRTGSAVFAEVALPAAEGLDLQLAGRFEDYGGGLQSTDPRLALTWRAHENVTFRASTGTSFRAPSLFQSFASQTSLVQLVDPHVGTPQFFPVRTRPHPSGATLDPERAHMLDVGLSWSFMEGWEARLNYWAFRYRDVIVEQDPQGILNAAASGDAPAATQIVRDPLSGLLERVEVYYENASSLESDGVDLRIGRTLLGRAGDLRLAVEATYVHSYDLVDPAAGAVEGAGRRNFGNFGTSVPQWRARLPLAWTLGAHTADVALGYTHSYTDDQTSAGIEAAPDGKIDAHLTVDARYARTFGRRGLALAIGVVNLTDEKPPHVATNGGYDSKVHDPRGRVLYAKTSFAF